MDTLTNFRRTHYCGAPRITDAGSVISVCGWVQRRRDLGGLLFVDLRDRTGILQLAFGDETERGLFERAQTLRSEYVIAATGVLRERSSKNADIPTGDVELAVTELRILAQSETPPFEITDNSDVGEQLRLKYRYLDLRRPSLTRNIILRHKIAALTRDYFYGEGFIEIETPMLIKSTPEGARDYLVPSRVHRGNFYALPQSPQLYKQLSMVAGFDRYIQLARCFRDEDLRADRQPEFTQIDLEMSFVTQEDVIAVVEGYITRVFREILDIDIGTIPRMTYRDAMERYGSDKPDMRYGLEIVDVTDILPDTRAIKSPKIPRKTLDKLSDYSKGVGGRGVVQYTAYFVTDEQRAALSERVGGVSDDETVLLLRDTLLQIGQLRVELAKTLGVIPTGVYKPLWILEFPYFELDEETGEWNAMHHPFTAPLDECLQYLETDKGKVRAQAYDLVLNGIELSSGSIRVTDPALQSRLFTLLGISEEDAQRKFGFLLDAFRYGAPPHGGMALGLDRLVMQLIGAESLRDVVAYPKLANATEPMVGSPDTVDAKQLAELGITAINS
ncbi:MAG: aspartate--tRNA ligase [Oscillospiraceae bacterium]|jgi:aspartyl-tRNA synthetase|nr:aspartate--tRNA ligase [Oscillospiraceae bacterium]